MQRNKILFITENDPFTHESGGAIVTCGILESLSDIFDIHVISKSSSVGLNDSLIHRKSIQYFPIQSEKAGGRYKQTYKDYFYSMIRFKPLFWRIYEEQQMFELTERLCQKNLYKYVIFDHLSSTQYCPYVTGSHKKILIEHNIEYKLQWDIFSISKNLRSKIFYFWNFVTMHILERSAMKKFDAVVTLSESDRQSLSALIDEKKIYVYNVNMRLCKKKIQSHSPCLIFIGNLWWGPNQDALDWFLSVVWPSILVRFPTLKLVVIGEQGKTAFKEKSKSNIIYTGKVKFVNSYLRQNNICILPFRIGQGIRIKALEALANGMPIISTKRGVQGINLENGVHYLEASTAQEFVEHINSLLNYPSLWKLLVSNGYKFITEQRILYKKYKISSFFQNRL